MARERSRAVFVLAMLSKDVASDAMGQDLRTHKNRPF
jgi:hypothetical protein